MIKTAMVGKQPGTSPYLKRCGEYQMDPQGWHGLMATPYHAAVINSTMADCIGKQVEAGIDIISEGECFRECYWQYSLTYLTDVVKHAPGHWTVHDYPTVKKDWLADDWEFAQSFTTKPVKITTPGPLTVSYYLDRTPFKDSLEDLARHFVKIINSQLKQAVERGCKHIQLDDPRLAFHPDLAKAFGIECMSACFEGIPDDVTRYVHACRGYPDAFTFETATNKADSDCYVQIMPMMDQCAADVISIENAFYPSPEALFEMVQNKTLMLGVVNIKMDHVESPDDIARSVEQVMRYIPSDRLILAPDCGCACDPNAFRAKMFSISQAAARF